jgi:hypothetical protein
LEVHGATLNCGSIELMSRPLAALAAVAVLAACSVPWAVQARAFTTGFKAGETIRYSVHTTVSGSLTLGAQELPLNSDQTLTEKVQVKSVDRSGTATVEVSVVDPVKSATGAASAAAPAPTTLKIASDGRILAGAAAQLGGPIPSIPGSDQLTPLLSTKPVKPGDSWSIDYMRPNPYGSGGFHFSGRTRYLRNDAVGGEQAAVMETTLGGAIDFTIDFSKLPAPQTPANPPAAVPQGPVHYTGSVTSITTYWVALTSEQVLKASASGSYALDYGLASAGGVSGPQQVAFNGTIRTDLTQH